MYQVVLDDMRELAVGEGLLVQEEIKSVTLLQLPTTYSLDEDFLLLRALAVDEIPKLSLFDDSAVFTASPSATAKVRLVTEESQIYVTGQLVSHILTGPVDAIS
jgi:hypothetical protein